MLMLSSLVHSHCYFQTLLPRGGPDAPLRERNSRVNSILAEYVKGNSRVQLVNIDTGFVQVSDIVHQRLAVIFLSPTRQNILGSDSDLTT